MPETETLSERLVILLTPSQLERIDTAFKNANTNGQYASRTNFLRVIVLEEVDRILGKEESQ